VGQKGDRFSERLRGDPNIDQIFLIQSGKFRRYRESKLKQMLNMKTQLLNARDLGRVVRGFFAARRVIKKVGPDVVFIKGGFVGVPVGLAAATRKIPFVTHDSDVVPGLANRIIAPWASVHAVAYTAGSYPGYSPGSTVRVGVPVSQAYRIVGDQTVLEYKNELGLAGSRVLLVTGGGLGADRLNDLVCLVVPDLLKEYEDLIVVHQAGENLIAKVERSYSSKLNKSQLSRVRVLGFTTELFKFSAVADVVVARAGATTLAELAAQGKASVIVPNDQLSGGHQTKNARLLADSNAVKLVQESSTAKMELTRVIVELLDDDAERAAMSKNLHLVYGDNLAVEKIIEILLNIAENKDN
jgi:UDP-N-acetylglucosamine--N-acetylmuramyl-(pentapeptide) pyrophosphoryl-undecaprenol N-acetylglucosamine transferase